MGGSINVALRLRTGKAFCFETWTNALPRRFKDPRILDGDDAFVEHFLDDLKEYGKRSQLTNSEYGLIVIDYLTNTIIDNNLYFNMNTFDNIEISSRVADRGVLFEAHAKRGSLSFRKRMAGGVIKTKHLTTNDAMRHARKLASPNRGWFGMSSDGTITDFVIDMSPMTFVEMPDRYQRGAWKPYKAKLMEIGFPMNKAAGLNKD